MADIASYQILVYGSPDGYIGNRAQIELRDAANNVIAWVRFNDPGMPFENDALIGGVIAMQLPTTMFDGVVDMLRNESPIFVKFAQNRAFLGTANPELIGEGE